MPFYPRPNRAADNLAGANNFRASLVNAVDRKNLMGKIDHSLGEGQVRRALHLYPTIIF